MVWPQDTSARLQWLALAVQPYLHELSAKVSVRQALER